MIVDCDAHHYETEHYREIAAFIEDPVIRHRATGGFNAHKKTGNRPTMFAGHPGYQEMAGRITRYRIATNEKVPAAPHRDIDADLQRWMDAMGIDIACMFPTPMLQLGLHPQVEVEVRLARAYNRWLVRDASWRRSRASSRCSICRSTIRSPRYQDGRGVRRQARA